MILIHKGTASDWERHWARPTLRRWTCRTCSKSYDYSEILFQREQIQHFKAPVFPQMHQTNISQLWDWICVRKCLRAGCGGWLFYRLKTLNSTHPTENSCFTRLFWGFHIQHFVPLDVTLEHQHLRPKQMVVTATNQKKLFYCCPPGHQPPWQKLSFYPADGYFIK